MNVLAIGAHFDDLEVGCSGTLIKHVQKGDKVTLMVVTDSAYDNPDGQNIRSAETAALEGQKGAKIIGANLIALKHKTFFVPFDEKLTKEINYYIGELSIDTLYCHWINDLHRDHQYTAKCAIMASRHVPRVLMYRSNYYDTHEIFRGIFYSDISTVFSVKIEAIQAHQSELKRVNGKWIDFIKRQNANEGQKIGVEFAETFEIIRYLI